MSDKEENTKEKPTPPPVDKTLLGKIVNSVDNKKDSEK